MTNVKPQKAKPKLKELDLTVVGLSYRLSARDMQQLEDAIEESGAIKCRLELEPENPVDPKAVKVIVLDPERKLFHGWHIGYLRRPANAHIFEELRRGAVVKGALLTWIDPDAGEAELQLGIVRGSNG